MPASHPTAADVRARFDATPGGTLGVEEELLLVDASSWRPAGVAHDVVERAADARIKTELPACQVEIATGVHAEVGGALDELQDCRARVAAACPPGVVPVAAAVHPLVDGPVDLAPTQRSAALRDHYREVIARQLVASLQVHVAVGGADRTLAVYNGLRDVLPELAAVAAAGPFLGGRDTGLCSARPVIATQLPRQGVPPSIHSWEGFAADLAWASRGVATSPSVWWWELRPHLVWGTLELRVMDVQPDTGRTGALVALADAVAPHHAARFDAGDRWEGAPSWRIAENRWSALRDGVDGHLLDLDTGDPAPTRTRLHRLIDLVEPHAACSLDGARALVEHGTAALLRAQGVEGALPWLAERFLVGPPVASVGPG
jgi:carboxylate-amine ligase